MTETFKSMLVGAKTVDEAYEVLCLHANEFTRDEQIKLYQTATGKSELTEEELDMVVGGSWLSSAWKYTKRIGNTIGEAVGDAATATEKWCANHKKELIIAACVVGGIAVGSLTCGVGFATGFITAAEGTSLAGAATFGCTITGIAGGAIGLAVGLGITDKKK